MAGSVCIMLSGLKDTKAFRLGDKRQQIQDIINYLWGVAQGVYPATMDVAVNAANAARATGTLTIASGSGTVGGTIAGTAVTVTWGTSDTATATALAAAVNANTTVNKLVKATSAAGVVTLTAHVAGPLGNKITLVASGTGVTATSGTLGAGTGQTVGAGGADNAPTSYSFA